jgi:nicotinamidase-related amidase
MFKPEYAALLVIDMQEKLFPAMSGKETLETNTVKLIKGAQEFGIPVIVTEQNPVGLGPTIPSIASLLPDMEPLRKFSFSCPREKGFADVLAGLRKQNRFQILLAGIEAHICIYQTAMDLRGHDIQVVADCISSRTPENRDTAIRRMETEGLRMTTTEMILFELLGTSTSEQFKNISAIVK